ncbi:unnamed protein product [Phyllotreta striolata]|uniref:G-protein coupled receptors family 2 profile 2 domain-containing protein n=1 Tax=Phyllotreta striolata TaxID=444603 RepID=A0A9N9TI15_PHYSR|nr:unnamed protein product [Phyllotreta striolata]
MCSLSEPICLKTNNDVAPRCCLLNETWENSTNCSDLQEAISNPCPEGSRLIEDICIFLIKATSYPFLCPYEENLPFDEYWNHINVLNVAPIWLPVERSVGIYGEGLFYWNELSSKYQSPFTGQLKLEKHIVNKNCLIQDENNYVKVVACTDIYTGVCAYRPITKRMKSFCSQVFGSSCKQSDYSTKSKCFCKTHTTNNETRKAELLIPYQNLLFDSLDEICYIGLEKKGDRFLWINSNIPINYTYWSNNTHFGEKYDLGAMSSNGWVLKSTEDDENCTIIEIFPPVFNASLILSEINSTTLVAISNEMAAWKQYEHSSEPMIFCFTDAANDAIISKLDMDINIFNSTLEIKFSVLDNVPGNYWCEGFAYPDLKAVKSNVYYKNSKNSEFVALISAKYLETVYPLSTEYIKEVYEGFRANLESSLRVFNELADFFPRLYKIVEIDEKNCKLVLNFHITTIKSSRIPYTKMYANLSNALANMISPYFNYTSALFTNSCIGFKSGDVIWPTIKISATVYQPTMLSDEMQPECVWCFDNKGHVATQTCGGDYINGGTWIETSNECNLMYNLDLSPMLESVVRKENPEAYISLVHELVATKKFETTDVEYLVSYLKRLSDTKIVKELDKFVDLVNEILMLDEDVLKQSQLESDSNNKMLRYMYRILEKTDFPFQVIKPHFSIVGLSLETFDESSIFWIKYNDSINVDFLNYENDILGNNPNIHVGLIFNRPMLNNLKRSHSRIAIVAFFKDSLFKDKYFQTHAPAIFSIIFPDQLIENEESLEGLLTAVYICDNPQKFSCSYWSKDTLNSSYWYQNSQSNIKGSKIFCNFAKLRNVGLVSTMNITDILEELLQDITESCITIFNRINMILYRYSSQLQSKDISLMIQLIERCFNDTSMALQIVDKILDWLSHNDRITSIDSNENVEAHLLNTFYLIVNNSNINNISQRNFAAFKMDSSSADIVGFHVKTCASNCQITVDPQQLDNELQNDKEIRVRMNSALIRQFQSAEQVFIFVVFSNLALFKASNTYNRRTKIVGLLADTLDILDDGNVTILYSGKGNAVNQSCELWSKGNWNPMQPPQEPPVNTDVVDCEFWSLGYYALFYNELNVTAIIEEVICQSWEPDVKLDYLGNIARDYKNLIKPEDLDLLATFVINMANDNPTAIVCKLARLLTTLMDIPPSVLRLSQKQYGSSDTFLHSLNLVNQKLTANESFCSDDNPKLLVVKTFEGSRGIALNTNEGNCKFNEITGDVPLNSDSGVLIIQSNNRVENNGIVITAFRSNSLFISEENEIIPSNIIFGVPTFDEEMDKLEIYINKNFNESLYLECLYRKDWGDWSFAGKFENNKCSYTEPGYYTLWEANDNQFNITRLLQFILLSAEGQSKEGIEKLQRIAEFYDRFQTRDVSLLVECCLTIISQKQYLLQNIEVITNIVISFFKIPLAIKQESQIEFNAIKLFLNFVSLCGKEFYEKVQFQVEDYLQIITCYLIDGSIDVTISNNVLMCNEKENLQYEIKIEYAHSGYLATSLFKENELFVNEQSSKTSKVVGVSVSDPNFSVTVKFSNAENKFSNYVCSMWTFSPSKKGQWNTIATEITSDEILCTPPGNSADDRYIALAQLNLKDILNEILSSRLMDYSEKLRRVWDAIPYYRNQFESSNVEQIYQIIKTGRLTDSNSVKTVVQIINFLMDLDKSILVSAQNRYNTTENLLDKIDDMILEFEDEILLTNYNNFAIAIKSNLNGILFEANGDGSYVIKDVLHDDSKKIASLDTSLIIRYSGNKPVKLYLTFYFNNALFNEKCSTRIRNQAIIVGVGVSDSELKQSLSMFFNNYEDNSNICAYWNHKTVTSDSQTGYWETITEKPCHNRQNLKYFALLEKYNVTSDLQDIFNSSKAVLEKLKDVIDIVRRNSDVIKPYDVFLISEILGLLHDKNITKQHVNLTSQVISELFNVNRTVLEAAQEKFGVTDDILYTVDETLRNCVSEIEKPISYDDFSTFKVDVKSRNFTTLMFENCTQFTCDVSFMNIENFTDITNNSFNTMVSFDQKLLKQIKRNKGPVYLAVTLYFRDSLFNENKTRDDDKSNIIGIFLEGLDKDQLEGSIYFMYNIENMEMYVDTYCAYWKYRVNDDPLRGFWQNDSTPTKPNGFPICQYDHLTHFVLLLAPSTSVLEELNNSRILDIVTNINSVMSLLGLFGILLTAVMFDRWRNNTGNQILINFSVAISIKNVMLYISDGIYEENDKSMACTITGGILQYSILSEFCWMLIIAILQFKRFVEVLGSPLKYVLLKACICGWVFPALPVCLIIILDVNNYNKSEIGLCYPSGLGLYLGIWLPLIIIIGINFVIFVFILYNVFHKKVEYRDQVNHDIIFQWRLAILLFSMLGLTWIFGFLSLLIKSSIFAIMFCFLATLQGFIIFLFFIVFNKNVRFLYVNYFSSWMYSKGYKDRIN